VGREPRSTRRQIRCRRYRSVAVTAPRQPATYSSTLFL
jgi:hypothetical protein